MRFIFFTLLVFFISLPAYSSFFMGSYYCELFKDIKIEEITGDINVKEGDMLKRLAKGPNDYVHSFKVEIKSDQLVFSKGEKAVFVTPVTREVFDKFKITYADPVLGVTAEHEYAFILIRIDNEYNFFSTFYSGYGMNVRLGKCKKHY